MLGQPEDHDPRLVFRRVLPHVPEPAVSGDQARSSLPGGRGYLRVRCVSQPDVTHVVGLVSAFAEQHGNLAGKAGVDEESHVMSV